jgi:hypothetical protein
VQTLTVADLPNRSLSVDPGDFLSDQLDFQDIDYASQLIHCRHASLASPIPFGQFKQNGIPNQLDRAIAWADERREVITPLTIAYGWRLQSAPVARTRDSTGVPIERAPELHALLQQLQQKVGSSEARDNVDQQPGSNSGKPISLQAIPDTGKRQQPQDEGDRINYLAPIAIAPLRRSVPSRLIERDSGRPGVILMIWKKKSPVCLLPDTPLGTIVRS